VRSRIHGVPAALLTDMFACSEAVLAAPRTFKDALAITQSVAFFFDPDPNAMIECLPS
jgi:hypothetical protein